MKAIQNAPVVPNVPTLSLWADANDRFCDIANLRSCPTTRKAIFVVEVAQIVAQMLQPAGRKRYDLAISWSKCTATESVSRMRYPFICILLRCQRITWERCADI
jgi:hypothetical protein